MISRRTDSGRLLFRQICCILLSVSRWRADHIFIYNIMNMCVRACTIRSAGVRVCAAGTCR
jgi:hypothetical protein